LVRAAPTIRHLKQYQAYTPDATARPPQNQMKNVEVGLKKDARTRNIPIIGMSAYAEVSEREKAIATGCDEFDTKPIEFESLVATIRRVFAKPK
jgi:CheY-like chemotaxis protein